MKDHCNLHGGQQLYRDMRSAARAPAFTASNPIIATWNSRAFDSSASIPRRQTLRPPAAASVPTGQPLPSSNAAWSYQGHDSTLRSRPLPAAAPLLRSSSALPRAANPYPAAVRSMETSILSYSQTQAAVVKSLNRKVTDRLQLAARPSDLPLMVPRRSLLQDDLHTVSCATLGQRL